MNARILLVDDSQELLNAYLAFLQSTTTYEIGTASSGDAALDIMRTWRPDVVVIDLIMPDMNGLALITHIRSELAPPLPLIIAMSVAIGALALADRRPLAFDVHDLSLTLARRDPHRK